MKLDLKVKINSINTLKDKPVFKVVDLINLLKKLDENAKIKFGVISELNNFSFTQNDDFIFQITHDTREDEFEGNYTLNIFTEYKEI